MWRAAQHLGSGIKKLSNKVISYNKETYKVHSWGFILNHGSFYKSRHWIKTKKIHPLEEHHIEKLRLNSPCLSCIVLHVQDNDLQDNKQMTKAVLPNRLAAMSFIFCILKISQTPMFLFTDAFSAFWKREWQISDRNAELLNHSTALVCVSCLISYSQFVTVQWGP